MLGPSTARRPRWREMTRFGEEPVIAVPREREGGTRTAGVGRKRGIGSGTLDAWQAKQGGMNASRARKLKVH